MLGILKKFAQTGTPIIGQGSVEILPDSFGFLRSADCNYLSGPDDIYISPALIRKFGIRQGDLVEGEVKSPKDNEKYFAISRIKSINSKKIEHGRFRVHF